MSYSDATRIPPLMIAARHGRKDDVERLIGNGADISILDDRGYTPLHVASLRGYTEIVELLIANGANINACAEYDCTPLYQAAWGQHLDIVELLLDSGAVMEPDIALMLGNIELVKYYLEEGFDVNSRLARGLSRGQTWLAAVVELKHRNLVELFLNRGVRIHEKSGTCNMTALHYACGGIKGIACQDICELLLAHGADIEAEDEFGNTPLHRAAKLEHNDIVELLLDCGANVNALNQAQKSPLFEAVRLRRISVVQSLLSHGAEVNLTDRNGFTPLMGSTVHEGIFRLLLAYGADVNVNVRSPSGKRSTLLGVAMQQQNTSIIELLLAYGARKGLE